MFECEHRWELVLWGSTEVLGVVSGISRQCLMHILADLLSKITSCEQLKGDCTKSPSPQARHLVPPLLTDSFLLGILVQNRSKYSYSAMVGGHPGTWLEVLELVNHWSRQLSGMPPQLPWPWGGPQ